MTYFRAGSAASHIGRSDAERAASLARRFVHTSGVTPALSDSCADAIAHLLDSRRAGLRISFDVNYRPQLWGDQLRAASRLHAFADAADLVFVGLDEAQTLWGVDTVDDVRALIRRPATLVVKDSHRSAVAFVGNERHEVPALSVEVIEPVGAGDAFAAGYLHAILCGWPIDVALRSGHIVARSALRTVDDVGHVDASRLASEAFDVAA